MLNYCLIVSVISFIVPFYYLSLRLIRISIGGLILLLLLIKSFILIIFHLLILSLVRLVFISLLLLQRIIVLTKCNY